MEEIVENNIRTVVAGYVRVSTQNQKDSENSSGQKTLIREFCVQNNFDLIEPIYADEGWSGTLSVRPDSDRLIADAKAGLFGAVVITAIDRISRDSEAYYHIVPELEKYVRVIYIQTPVEGENKELLEPLYGGIAAFEKKHIARRFATGKKEKVFGKKEFMGHIPSYGYRYIFKDKHIKEPGHLEIREDESKIVKMVFRWVGNENVSANDVVRRLTDMRVPTRNHLSKWAKSSVLRMLRNESYIGKFHHNRRESVIPKRYSKDVKYRKNPKTGRRFRPREEWATFESESLRLVDDRTFEMAQEALKRNTAFSKRNTKHDYLLGSGLIKCEVCDCSYYSTSLHGIAFYKCGNKTKRFPLPKTCNSSSVSAKKIETAVWNLIHKILKDPKFLIEQLRKNRDLFQKERVSIISEMDILETQVANLGQEESRLVEAVQKNALTVEQVREPLGRLKFDRTYLASRIKAFQGKLKEVEVSEGARKDIKAFCGQIRHSLDDLSFDEKQAIIRLVVKQIYFNGKRVRVRGYLPIRGDGENVHEIEFNPINPKSNGENQNIANIKLQHYIRNFSSKWEFEVYKKL